MIFVDISLTRYTKTFFYKSPNDNLYLQIFLTGANLTTKERRDLYR